MQFTSAIMVLNNWTEQDYTDVTSLVPSFFSYLVIGKEVGEEGTPHLQCYGEFAKRPAFGKIKSTLGARWHFEARKGTQLQAIEYITNNPSKPNPVYTELGKKKKAGERNDLHRTVALALESGVRAVAAISTSAMQIRHAEMALTYLEPERDWAPTVWWIHGPSGCGKTRQAFSYANEHYEGDVYFKGPGTEKWFSGYDAHACLILDDVTEHYFGSGTLRLLLELLDRYPCRVQTKGGQRQMLAEMIIITSVLPPGRIFDDVHGELKRRITNVTDCKLQEVAGNTEAATS